MPRRRLQDRFLADILTNRHNRAILDRWSALDLPDGWLVAGCLFQTVWNLQAGRAPEADIKDYDLFYFDASDTSEAAEQRVQAAQRVRRHRPLSRSGYVRGGSAG